MAIFKFDEIILSNKECEYIINLSKNRWESPSIRVNRPDRTTYFHTFKLGDDKLIDYILKKISDLLNKPIDKITGPQVNRYQVGESFPLHYDYDGTIQYTFLIYLNDDFVGGETHFPNGSSAIMIGGLLAKALAIPTLCCCPPESSYG